MVSQTFPQKRRLAQSRTKQLYPISTQIGAPVVILCLNLNRKQKPENGILPFFFFFKFAEIYVSANMIGFVCICESL